MRRVLVGVSLVAGCRSGFDVAIDAVDGNAPVDASGTDGADAPPGAVAVTFGETATADMRGVTADTYVSSESVTYNYGSSGSLSVEGSGKRALLRFDLSALPSGTTIFSARLQLSVSSMELSTSTVAIRPLIESWTEGTQTSAAGVANYTQRTATQNWTSPGAGYPGSSGDPIATVVATSLGRIGLDIPAATVQGWIDNASTNDGIAIESAGGSDVGLFSSVATTPSDRPELVVTYLP